MITLPMASCKTEIKYQTDFGVTIYRNVKNVDADLEFENMLALIDTHKGAIFSSDYEYPNRYSRWTVAFVNPCFEITAANQNFSIKSENMRGNILLSIINEKMINSPIFSSYNYSNNSISGTVTKGNEVFSEENRSKQNTIFSVLRMIKEVFSSSEDSLLGFFGAFGYDLVFQFEQIALKHARKNDSKDLLLYFPDNFLVIDRQTNASCYVSYQFEYNNLSTFGIDHSGVQTEYIMKDEINLPKLKKGEYANIVKKAVKSFKKGDLFEVVASHTLYEKISDLPSEFFQLLRKNNPSPYGFIINMGTEFLIGSSPEMFLRVEGNIVETCPISGTIKRGESAIDDANQIRKLLNSSKDESELTMCTDVDRNDKSRICIPGTVKLIGRRQIEIYSNLIHTVDHVNGILSKEYDSLDAFLSHMWAVTVTGAPKKAAIQWLEENESAPREWYGGAIGFMTFNGDLNTGLTLRTIKLKNGVAEIRVGATLLYDSVPEDEENETLLKANSVLNSVTQRSCTKPPNQTYVGSGKKILLVDHEDSFVHTLANYFKQTGADVCVYRHEAAQDILKQNSNELSLVVLSPGPGLPNQFKLSDTIHLAISKNLPIFGVCLGLQGIAEYFGGNISEMDIPCHGKRSNINVIFPSKIFDGLDRKMEVGRYHSLHVTNLPECINVVASTDDGIIMAIEHRDLPIAAVQFHPESIMTLHHGVGIAIITNVVSTYAK